MENTHEEVLVIDTRCLATGVMEKQRRSWFLGGGAWQEASGGRLEQGQGRSHDDPGVRVELGKSIC
jgi:hypothetical protein